MKASGELDADEDLPQKIPGRTEEVIHDIIKVDIALTSRTIMDDSASEGSSEQRKKDKGKEVMSRLISPQPRKSELLCKEKVSNDEEEDGPRYRGSPSKKIPEDKNDGDHKIVEESHPYMSWPESIWQALYFCYSHGIINRIIRKGQIGNMLPFDGQEIIAM